MRRHPRYRLEHPVANGAPVELDDDRRHTMPFAPSLPLVASKAQRLEVRDGVRPTATGWEAMIDSEPVCRATANATAIALEHLTFLPGTQRRSVLVGEPSGVRTESRGVRWHGVPFVSVNGRGSIGRRSHSGRDGHGRRFHSDGRAAEHATSAVASAIRLPRLAYPRLHTDTLERWCDKSFAGQSYSLIMSIESMDGFLAQPRGGAGRDIGGRHDGKGRRS